MVLSSVVAVIFCTIDVKLNKLWFFGKNFKKTYKSSCIGIENKYVLNSQQGRGVEQPGSSSGS